MEAIEAMLRRAFRAGFAVSREGFNAGCRFDHMAPVEYDDGDDPLAVAETAAVAQILASASEDDSHART